jgi:hypothetical protein
MALPKNRAHATIQWKIWYHDPESPTYCTTWSNQDGPAKEAPVEGVICVVQTADQGRSKDIVCQGDYYAIDEEGKWIGMDASGVADRRENNLHFHALKNGRWINTDRYQEIKSRAHNDPDFGGLNRPVLLTEVNFLVNRPFKHPGDN